MDQFMLAIQNSQILEIPQIYILTILYLFLELIVWIKWKNNKRWWDISMRSIRISFIWFGLFILEIVVLELIYKDDSTGIKLIIAILTSCLLLIWLGCYDLYHKDKINNKLYIAYSTWALVGWIGWLIITFIYAYVKYFM